MVDGGCEGCGVLPGTALLGADPWYCPNPHGSGGCTSSSTPAVALIYGGTALVVRANNSSWRGVCVRNR